MSEPPELTPEPGWVPVEPFTAPVTAGRFVSGDDAGERFRVAWFRREADGVLVGKAWLGPGTEGPPGHAHGGSIAALLDEAMSAAAWSSGHPVLSARLLVDFRRSIPVGSLVRLEARVAQTTERKVFTEARLDDESGEAHAEAEGLFLVMSPQQLERLGG